MLNYTVFTIVFLLLIKHATGTCSAKGNATCSLLANATFSEDFVYVKIQFNSSVKPIQPFSGCSSIFENATVAVLGRHPICSFTDHSTLIVYPDNFGSIKIDDVMVFKANSIMGGNGSNLNIGSVRMRSGVPQEFKPSPLITKYGYLSQCALDKFHMSCDLSAHSGYTQFSRFTWGLNGLTNNATAIALNASEYLVSQAANASEVLITNMVLSANMSITLNITNVFGSTGGIVTPVAQHLKPVARIQGSRNNVLPENAGFYLQADLSISKCGAQLKEVNYSWSISTPEGRLLEGAFTGRSLYLKPYSLSRDTTYNVSVNAVYASKDNITWSSSDTVSIHVKKVELVADIEGGDRDIGTNQTLVLNGKEVSGVKGGLKFIWQCIDLSSAMPCKTTQGLPMEFHNSTQMVLEMKNGKFTIGKRYQFKLGISQDTETAYSTIIVTIQELSVPLVRIIPAYYYHSSNIDITFRGIIFADAVNSTIQFNWKILEYNGNKVVHESQSKNLTTDLRNGSIPYIVMYRIPANTLINGYTYDVKLEVSGEGRRTTTSKSLIIDFTPRFGYLTIEPKQGTAFNTTFRLRSYGWIAHRNRKPLLYRFGYNDGSKIRSVSGWQSSNVLGETVFPQGDPQDGNKLNVFVEIKDTYGLIVKKEVSLMVSAQNSNDHDQILAYYQNHVNMKDKISMSTVIIGIMKSEMANETKRSYVETYLETIDSTSNISHLTSMFVDTIEDLVTMMNKSGNVLSQQSKERIARMAAKFSQEYETLVTYPKKTQLQSFLSIFDGILQSKESPSEEILQAFHNTSMTLLGLACRSIILENGLKINSSLITMSSGMEDLSQDFSSSSHFSVSHAYRSRHLQKSCTGENYVKCLGICWSTVAYTNKEHFLTKNDIGDAITKIHEARLIDLGTNKDVNTSTNGQDFLFKLPITGQYNSTNETVKCVMYDSTSLKWNGDYCQSSIMQENGGSRVAYCACNRLYAVVGIRAAKPTAIPSTTSQTSTLQSSTASPTPDPASVITVILHGNCTQYTSDELTKAYFIGNLTTSLASQLKISNSRVTIWSITCGSLVVNLTIADRGSSQTSEPTKAEAMTSLQGMLGNGLMRISLSDGSVLAAVAPGVEVMTTSLPTTVITTKPPVPDVTTNWMPMMASFALVLVLVIGISAFIAWLHGRYYKKKRYTDINSNRKKPKKQESIETMSKSKRMQQLNKIMDESIENAGVPSIIVPAQMSLKRTKRKPRITPINASTSFHDNSAFSSRTTLHDSARELPRLALDETSSESEAETSFVETKPRPQSTKSLKSRERSANKAKSTNYQMELGVGEQTKDYLSPSRTTNNNSANGRYSRQSSSSSSD